MRCTYLNMRPGKLKRYLYFYLRARTVHDILFCFMLVFLNKIVTEDYKDNIYTVKDRKPAGISVKEL
jgi:hypothetical protein